MPRRKDRPEIDGSILRWPGATNRFALFGEVMWVGILVVACSLPVITAPAAFAAGIRHLQRFLVGEASSAALFLREWVRALVGGVVVGLAVTAVALLLAWDVALATGGLLPGGGVVVAVSALCLLALGVALVVAAAEWSPDGGWRRAVRSVRAAVTGDPSGTCFIVVALVLTAVVTWQLLPLIVPGVGCLVFAVVAVRERPRSRR